MIAILTSDIEKGKDILEKIKPYFDEKFVFVSDKVNEWNNDFISYAKAYCLYKEKKLDKFFLNPEDNYFFRHKTYHRLKIVEIKDENIFMPSIYVLKEFNHTFSINDILIKYIDAKQLDYLQIRINYNCNLKCKGCAALAPLEDNNNNVDTELLMNDLKRTKEIFEHIDKFRVLGGEPLLDNNLLDYLKLIRRLYPYTKLILVTNGILLKSMDKHFFEELNKNNVNITISLYKPMWNKVDEIHQLLDKYGIVHKFNDSYEFHKSYNFNSNVSNEYNANICPNHCPTLEDGHICRCHINAKRINKFFNVNIPIDGDINIYDNNINAAEVRKRLHNAKPQCHICTFGEFFKWDLSKKDLDEWLINE